MLSLTAKSVLFIYLTKESATGALRRFFVFSQRFFSDFGNDGEESSRIVCSACADGKVGVNLKLNDARKES